jgi:Dr1-associated corepressor
MPRTRRQQATEAQQDPDYNLTAASKNAVQPKAEPAPPVMPAQPVDLATGIDVRTKFPVARIKRIMQADEDVGKVAQATPTAVGKFFQVLPSFSISFSF